MTENTTLLGTIDYFSLYVILHVSNRHIREITRQAWTQQQHQIK